MTETKKFHRRILPLFVFLILCVSGLHAQAADQATDQSRPAQAKGEPSASQTQAAPENKISSKAAEELFHSVDEILQFASKDTGLPLKGEVKRRLTNRDEVVAYLEKNMRDDKDTQRLRRSELVLKKFGLLPRDFDLQTFLVALLREQVAGYYDGKTKTVNLLDWVDAEQQKPVLAHELTHALQDQSFDVEKWLRAGDTDLDDKAQPTATDVEDDEISEARQAVVEGQATAVLIDYMLAPLDQSLLTSPQIADALKQEMISGPSDSVAFRSAPIFLQRTLTFPYSYGLDFETALLKAGGKEKAFAGVFANPPRSTRQIMEPETYLSGEHLPAMRLPDFQQDFKNYNRFDFGAIGELDVAVLVDQYAGSQASKRMYPHWRGGYYYAARPKNDATAPLAVLYFSRWSSPEAAADFAAIYARSLTKRYKRAQEVKQPGKSAAGDLAVIEALTGAHSWLTDEGLAVIAVQGDSVLVTESFDQPTTESLEKELEPPAAPK